MPFYVSLGRLTEQGRKTIKDSPKRFRETISMLEKTGVKFHQAFYTTGRYDLVTIVEAPNDQTALLAGLGSAAAGNVYWETLHAYTVDEIEKVVSKIP